MHHTRHTGILLALIFSFHSCNKIELFTIRKMRILQPTGTVAGSIDARQTKFKAKRLANETSTQKMLATQSIRQLSITTSEVGSMYLNSLM